MSVLSIISPMTSWSRRRRSAEITRETLLAKLDRAYKVAEKARNGSSMTAAVLGQARILGLIIDRREVGDAGSFSSMTDEELMRDAQERAARLGILGSAPKLVVDNVANMANEPSSDT
jgi:hypothetical protein